MNKGKKIIMLIVLTIILVVAGCLVASQFYVNKHKIVKSKSYSCEVENCPEMNGKSLDGSVDIYSEVSSEEQCKNIGGYPIIVYFGFTGERTYLNCGVKQD